MTLIVFTSTYTKPEYGDFDPNKFSVIKTVPESGSLTVHMNCTHNKVSDYRLMYWYRQLQGQTMRLIAFTTSYSKPEYEESELNKFVANKTVPERGSLTEQNFQPNDSATYSVQ